MIKSRRNALAAGKFYSAAIIATGIALVTLLTYSMPVINSWQQLTLFIVLLLLSNISSAQLSSGLDFSVAFIIELTLIQIYGVEVAVFLTFSSILVVKVITVLLGSKKGFYVGFLNASINVITVTGAGIAYKLLGFPLLGFVVASLIYFFIYVTLLTGYQWRNSDSLISYSETWVELGKEISLTFFVLSPMAYLIPYVFNTVDTQNKLFYVLLFFVPVMLVNYAYGLYLNIRQSYLNTVKTLVSAIEAKDPYVKGHAERVADYVLATAKEMGYPDKELVKLQYLSLLHDAGKIGVKDKILNKPAELNPQEYDEVKKHSIIGAQIIEKIKFLSSGAGIVKHHHERFDGSGYPDGLKGYDIPEGARILAVVDAYEAMTTKRPYRKAKTKAEALEELERCAGQQFDPLVVQIFKKVLKKQGEI